MSAYKKRREIRHERRGVVCDYWMMLLCRSHVRRLAAPGVLFALSSLEGCVVSSSPPQQPPPAVPRYAMGPMPPSVAPSATPVETYRPLSARAHAKAPLFVPGSQVQRLVSYDVVDGQAVMEGDVLLGPANSLLVRYGIPWAPVTNVKSAVAISNRSHLWPRGEMPYVIDPSAAGKTSAINGAIAQLNQTELELKPRTKEADYLVFKADGSGCYSYIGRIGGGQEVQIADCGQGSIIHEVLHAAGFYHEQSRGDRDQFITIVWDEISPGYRDNFEKRDDNGQDIGAYDYGSIMHYSSRAFSRSGKPTIIPRVANATIGQREGMSAGDRAAISALYGGGATPPQPSPPQPAPQPNPPAPQPMPTNAGFGGNYTSARGNVVCTQSAATVTCQYPGGSLFCTASTTTQLDCGWTGGGSGRAIFVRQASGVLAGTYGDFFSANSRGQWDLIPAGGNSAPPAPNPPQPAPPSPSTASSLSGNFTSTRGPLTCNENGSSVACTFTETASGRVDCTKDTTGLNLSCTWAMFVPIPGSGRAMFRRANASDRNLTGTWGYFMDAASGGRWDIQPR